jgi:DNA-binding PadR family transcriptional regulator
VSRAERELTTTSYAILGLLAIRPWSTYELALQMRRNLHYFWPRAESNLYAEPKRLVEGGFARAESQPVGKRRRTVYSITKKGQQALERWVGEPANESRLESETLVKIMFAPYGSKSDLLAHLQRFLKEVEAKQQHLRTIFQGYLAGEDPFPERVHINILCYRLIWAYTEAAASWASWAIARVGQWRDVATPSDRAALIEALEDALNERSPVRPTSKVAARVANSLLDARRRT